MADLYHNHEQRKNRTLLISTISLCNFLESIPIKPANRRRKKVVHAERKRKRERQRQTDRGGERDRERNREKHVTQGINIVGDKGIQPHPQPNPHTEVSRPLVFPLFYSRSRLDLR